MTQPPPTTNKATLLRQRLKAIVNDFVAPATVTAGFRRRANVYLRELSDLTWLIDIQESRWNSDDDVQFTINCGVYVPGATSIYNNRSESRRIDMTDCCVHTRVGMLAHDRLDKWWVLRSVDAGNVDSGIGEDIVLRLTRDVIPFLNRFVTTDNVLTFLTNSRDDKDRYIWPREPVACLCFAACIAASKGYVDDAQRHVNLAYSTAKIAGVIDAVLRVHEYVDSMRA